MLLWILWKEKRNKELMVGIERRTELNVHDFLSICWSNIPSLYAIRLYSHPSVTATIIVMSYCDVFLVLFKLNSLLVDLQMIADIVDGFIHLSIFHIYEKMSFASHRHNKISFSFSFLFIQQWMSSVLWISSLVHYSLCFGLVSLLGWLFRWVDWLDCRHVTT